VIVVFKVVAEVVVKREVVAGKVVFLEVVFNKVAVERGVNVVIFVDTTVFVVGVPVTTFVVVDVTVEGVPVTVTTFVTNDVDVVAAFAPLTVKAKIPRKMRGNFIFLYLANFFGR